MKSDLRFDSPLVFDKAGKLLEAKKAYLDCLARSPNHVRALINVGGVCRQLGNNGEAIGYLSRAIACAPRKHAAHYNPGNALRDKTQYEDAANAYRDSLAISPKDPASWYNLAIVLRQLKDSRQTWSFLNNIGLPGLAAHNREDYIRLAINLANSPDTLDGLRFGLRERMAISPLCDVQGFTRFLEEAYYVAWWKVMTVPNIQTVDPIKSSDTTVRDAATVHQQGVERLQTGDSVGATDLLRQSIVLNPTIAAYHSNLAVALKGCETNNERADLYRHAIALDPQDPIIQANLAAVLNDIGDFRGGEAQAKSALSIAPERLESWLNLGGALAGKERWTDAAKAFDIALRLQPEFLPALEAAGKAHRAARHLDLSLARYRQARQQLKALLPGRLDPTDPILGKVSHALGEVLSECLDHASAESCLREALLYLPDDLALLTDLANALKAQDKLDEASPIYRRVVSAAPHLPGSQVNMGTLAQSLGRHEEAVDHFRAALVLDPKSLAIYSNLGTSLTYSIHFGPVDLNRVYDDFDRHLAQPLRDTRPHLNDRSPDRRLRVGYVSPDFRKHAVAYFALPLLEGHHSDQVEVVCYYNHRQIDEWTRRFKAAASEWVDCVGFDHAALAQRIRDDGIDILVDLAGHTENNRLLAFARKPAPLQVTWMGYVTTTGLSAMDYRITHADADPPGVEADYAETLVRIPGTMWCYRPLPGMPAVSPPPFQRNGHVTFGSFNRYSKVSRRVLDCWVRILLKVPDSRLLLCIPEGAVRQEVTDLFAQQGVRRSRLTLFSKVSHEQFWDLHGDVDIALDPFPFNGGTTTCETLWMGVPLITCSGGPNSFAPRFASRMGRTFLAAVGLAELATADEAAYVETAVTLAGDPARMVRLRATLRQAMAASPLTDEPRFVAEVEAAYRAMWHKWCAAGT